MKEKCFNHGYYVMVRFKADKSGYNKSTQFQDIVQTVEFPPIEYKSRITLVNKNNLKKVTRGIAADLNSWRVPNNGIKCQFSF